MDLLYTTEQAAQILLEGILQNGALYPLPTVSDTISKDNSYAAISNQKQKKSNNQVAAAAAVLSLNGRLKKQQNTPP